MDLVDAAKLIGHKIKSAVVDHQDVPPVDHLPRNEQEVDRLSVGEKILSSAMVSSGCDAVAYYKADGGQFKRVEHMDLYDFKHQNPTAFPDKLAGFDPNTFSSEDQARKISEEKGFYQIPVRNKHGDIEGIVLLHPPQDGFIRVQTEQEGKAYNEWASKPTEERNKTPMPDAHEPAAVRVAKLEMAGDIVDNFSNQLLHHAARHLAAGQDIGTPQVRDDFILRMAKDELRTYPQQGAQTDPRYDAVRAARNGDEFISAVEPLLPHFKNMQTAHVIHTGELMGLTADAINDGQARPLLTDEQRSAMKMLGVSHDDGKNQFPFTSFQDSPAGIKDNAQFSVDSAGRNANHAFLDYPMFSLYPATGRTIGNHHHGHNRYSDEEIKKKGLSEYVIAPDHVQADHVSTLSRMLRIDDVTDAITARTDKSLMVALQEMAFQSSDFGKNKDGKPKSFKDVADEVASGGKPSFTEKTMDPNTIDRDMLCYMIEHHVFERYGELRNAQENALASADGKEPKGWLNSKGAERYNAEELKRTEETILKAFNWEERKKELVAQDETRENKIRFDVQHDAAIEAPGTGPNAKKTRSRMSL